MLGLCILGLFIDVTVKASLLVVAMLLIITLVKRGSASFKHGLWSLLFFSLLALPLLTLSLPKQQITVPFLTSLTPWLATPKTVVETSPPSPLVLLSTMPRTKTAQVTPSPYPFYLVAGWLIGFSLVLLRVLLDGLKLWQLARKASELHSLAWLESLALLKHELRLERPVRLLHGTTSFTPMTWGFWQPVILLPATAKQWSEEERRIVLLHELAHIKRFDWLWQVLALLVCALYWYNPLVWLAARKLRAASEEASDDVVLLAGTKASSYAQTLLAFATTPTPLQHVVPMTGQSQLSQRLLSILHPLRQRTLPSARTLLIMTMATLLSVVLLASLRVQAKATSLTHYSKDFQVSYHDAARGIATVVLGHGVQVAPNLEDIEITSDGFFVLVDRVTNRSLELRSENKKLLYHYVVNGQATRLNREAQAWLNEHLLTLTRVLESFPETQQRVQIFYTATPHTINVFLENRVAPDLWLLEQELNHNWLKNEPFIPDWLLWQTMDS
jgi:beta-lactamase regulating signal transducer with metallopeptidase domain